MDDRRNIENIIQAALGSAGSPELAAEGLSGEGDPTERRDTNETAR